MTDEEIHRRIAGVPRNHPLALAFRELIRIYAARKVSDVSRSGRSSEDRHFDSGVLSGLYGVLEEIEQIYETNNPPPSLRPDPEHSEDTT